MFVSGMKVTKNPSYKDYPELIAEEYTVEFSYMTESWTWVILKEYPDKKFNEAAFHGPKEGNSFFAIRSSRGGFIISDIEYLACLVPDEDVLGIQKVFTEDEMWDYFAKCAVCSDKLSSEAGKNGCLIGGDMATLLVCPECCSKNSGLNIVFIKPLTYRDRDIDWFEELKLYGEATGRPTLNDDIANEIEAYCEECEGADESPECAPGECPYYSVQDFLAQNHPELFQEVKRRGEERLREQYPDPNEH